MRLSAKQAIRYILESEQNEICPQCGKLGPHSTKEQGPKFDAVDGTISDSYDIVMCYSCSFKWESAFRVVLSPIVNR